VRPLSGALREGRRAFRSVDRARPAQIEASHYLARTFRAHGANGESQTLRVYAAKTLEEETPCFT